MNSRFAKGIALNISAIAQATTQITLIEKKVVEEHSPNEAIDKQKAEIKKAEDRIAEFLMQPGTWK